MLLDPLVCNMKHSLTNLQFFSLSLVCGDFCTKFMFLTHENAEV
jgi:hypothetical protein